VAIQLVCFCLIVHVSVCLHYIFSGARPQSSFSLIYSIFSLPLFIFVSLHSPSSILHFPILL